MNLLERVRPELLQIAGYASARMEASGGSVLLNANESPWPAEVDGAAGLNRYPQPQPPLLRRQLAAYYGVPPENLLLGRGSDEAIDWLTRLFCRAGQDSVVIAVPTFGMYAQCAAVQGAAVVDVTMRADAAFALAVPELLRAVRPETKLVFVCSPNNPTGASVPRADLLALADALDQRALLVVDEAYIEFADEASLAPEVLHRPNIAVLRTMSKAHALAGARLGGLIANRDVIALCRKIMAPYPLPTATIQAGMAALSDEALGATSARVARICSERERMRASLPEQPQVRAVLPSQANFLCVRFEHAGQVYDSLRARGIVVRDVSRQPGLEDCLRISIGRPKQNDALLAALDELGATI
jgi:histidinol-phosphate aminotransferase